MIEYSFLCQAISDWRSGRRPSSGPLPSASYAAPDEVEEVDSAVIVEDGQGYAQQGYDQQAYAQQDYDQQGYDQPGPYASEDESIGFEDAEEEVQIDEPDAAEPHYHEGMSAAPDDDENR